MKQMSFTAVKNLIWRCRFLMVVLVFSLPAITDLLKPGYFSMHDDLQILRLQQLDKCVHDFQLPCRWVPDPGFGYGYPMFNYYPPLPYFLAEVFYIAGFNLFWSIKIVFILSIILSGLFMFALISELLSPLAGVVAAVFYVWAPYHSVDVYVRGAMNEAWGLTFFPLILLFAYKLAQGNKNKFLIPGLALSFSALLLSHNVMTLIFGPILAVWSLFWLCYFKNFRQITKMAIAGLWGIGLAAFFFLPVTLESRLVHVETMTIGYFNYLAHFADINQLFFSRFWGFGGSTWGPGDDMAFPVGHFHWVIALIALVAGIFLIIKSIQGKIKLRQWPISIFWICFFVFIGMLYIFLTHSRAVWFWDHLPLLYFAQFPWRLLAVPALAFSILAGVVIYLIRSWKVSWLIAAALLVGVVVWNYPFFKIQKQVTVTTEEKFSGSLWELQVTGGIFDYLPKTASRPPGGPAFIYPQFIEGNGGILDFQRGTNWLKFTARVSTDQAVLQLPLFEFPRTIITIDGRKTAFGHDADLGRLEIQLAGGEHRVEAKIEDTPIRTLSNIVSLISLGLLIKYIHAFKS